MATIIIAIIILLIKNVEQLPVYYVIKLKPLSRAVRPFSLSPVNGPDSVCSICQYGFSGPARVN